MRFSFIYHVFISEHFHAITIFKLVGLWIQLFIKLFVIWVIFSQFSLLKFNNHFKRSDFFTIFIWKPIYWFFCSFQHLVIKLGLIALNSHVHFVIFKRFINLKFDTECFPFIILNHVFYIVNIWQSCRDIIFACDCMVIL